MILTETKIAYQAYFRNSLVYDVVCSPIITMASGGAQGGVGLFVQDQPQG